jgi:hypothetical protein
MVELREGEGIRGETSRSRGTGVQVAEGPDAVVGAAQPNELA